MDRGRAAARGRYFKAALCRHHAKGMKPARSSREMGKYRGGSCVPLVGRREGEGRRLSITRLSHIGDRDATRGGTATTRGEEGKRSHYQLPGYQETGTHGGERGERERKRGEVPEIGTAPRSQIGGGGYWHARINRIPVKQSGRPRQVVDPHENAHPCPGCLFVPRSTPKP